jgi:hypothetical protein
VRAEVMEEESGGLLLRDGDADPPSHLH